MLVQQNDEKLQTEPSCPFKDEEVWKVVKEQLIGYGYYAATYDGKWCKVDYCYSNDGTQELFFATPKELLEDAISYRAEVLEESAYKDYIPAIQELEAMENYLAEMEMSA